MIEDADTIEEEDYIDFCTEHETEDRVIDLAEANVTLTKRERFDNKAQSYRCGPRTAIKFCTSQE